MPNYTEEYRYRKHDTIFCSDPEPDDSKSPLNPSQPPQTPPSGPPVNPFPQPPPPTNA